MKSLYIRLGRDSRPSETKYKVFEFEKYLKDNNYVIKGREISVKSSDGKLVYFNVFVEKPFLELPPDWDKEEKMWKTGDLFKHFNDWKILTINETIFEDNSGGVKHYHCMDSVMARKIV